MLKLCLVVQWLLVNLLDVVTTGQVTPDREINPLVRFLWRRWGFGAICVLKVVIVFTIIATWGAMWDTAARTGNPEFANAAFTSAIAHNALMSVVVLWNIYVLTFRKRKNRR